MCEWKIVISPYRVLLMVIWGGGVDFMGGLSTADGGLWWFPMKKSWDMMADSQIMLMDGIHCYAFWLMCTPVFHTFLLFFSAVVSWDAFTVFTVNFFNSNRWRNTSRVYQEAFPDERIDTLYLISYRLEASNSFLFYSQIQHSWVLYYLHEGSLLMFLLNTESTPGLPLNCHIEWNKERMQNFMLSEGYWLSTWSLPFIVCISQSLPLPPSLPLSLSPSLSPFVMSTHWEPVQGC